jgi:hypothetical protein
VQGVVWKWTGGYYYYFWEFNLNSERNISGHGITDLLRLQYNYSFHLGTPAVMTAQRLLATLFLYN